MHIGILFTWCHVLFECTCVLVSLYFRCEGTLVEVAIVRTSARGEWDLSVEEEEGIERREVLDDGEQRIRASQQENKYEAASSALMTASAKA